MAGVLPGPALAHELLFALSGYAGDVIIERDGAFLVDPGADFIDRSDRALMNRLVTCGALYRTIIDFAATEHDPGVGMYHRALCIGIEADVLAPYRAEIVAAEREYVLDPDLPLAHLHELVHRHVAVFRHLAKFIEEHASGAARSVLGGAAMMDLLHEHANSSGVPAIHACLGALFRRCYAVMVNQIVAWAVHGNIVDPNGEFFIQRVSKARIGLGGRQSAGSSGGSSARAIDGRGALRTSARAVGAADDVHFISLLQMPQCCMSMRLAEVILFTGEAVRVAARATIETGAPQLNPAALAAAAAALRAVKVQPQQTFALESAFGALKQLVARHTWDILVDAAQLPAHLRALKNYFLLAKGDVWAAFIERGGAMLLHDVPTKARVMRGVERNLNAGALASAAATCSCDDDELFQRVSLCLELPRIDVGKAGGDGGAAGRATLVPGRATPRQLPLDLRSHGLETVGQVHTPSAEEAEAEAEASAADAAASGGRRSRVGVAFRLGRGVRRDELTTLRESARETFARRRSGSVWSTRKQRVDYGFDCEFSFRLESADARLAFVVQNSRRAPLAFVPAQRANVRLALGARRSASAVAVAFHGDGVGILANDDYAAFDGDVPEDVVAAHWMDYTGLASGAAHRARVVYSEVGGGGGGGGGGGAKKRWELKLYLWRTAGPRPADHVAPILQRVVDLRDRRHVGADLYCGAAWVGLCGSSDGELVAEDGASGGSGVAVSQWTFQSVRATDRVGTRRTPATFTGLHLGYDVMWPLQLIITPSALERYNVLFQFLFRFKFVESNLKQAWGTLVHTPRAARSVSLETNHLRRRLWFLRARMAFIVSNIIFYLQVDVVEVQSEALLGSLSSSAPSAPRRGAAKPRARSVASKIRRASREFESLRKAHERSLDNMVRLSFLQVRQVRYAIDDVLQTCQRLCTAVHERGGGALALTESQVVELDRTFARQVHWLLLKLSGASSAVGGGAGLAARALPRADALLLRLNFNGYWEESVAAYARAAR